MKVCTLFSLFSPPRIQWRRPKFAAARLPFSRFSVGISAQEDKRMASRKFIPAQSAERGRLLPADYPESCQVAVHGL